ncbi:hypothetical protein A1D25_10390 [Ursidibacter arcticus]|uniref:hypothetical protein n=1 Tax=Ursidibacter arcticus TaxID=1524965 RepID=UPI0012FB97DE|nr:hypothetical protein [Ursidibacter arcticus]KAE9537071.1 hypothetical protein A1D25_10390 [Ursidibacter arcticus]
MSIALQCEFWAVGQGLFSSGKVLSGGNTAFSWVYDCGTLSKQKYIHSAINTVNNTYNEIDLLVISHFDDDHVNQLDKLFQKTKPKFILLPYCSLWQRIMWLFLNDIDLEDEMFSFYLDPVQYLSKNYPDIINEATLLLVPSYQKIEHSTPEEADKLSFSTWHPEDSFIHSEIKQWKETVKDIKLLDPTSPINVSGVEFFPYNMPLKKFRKKPKDITVFQQQILNIIENNPLDKSTISQLENLYNQAFGKNSTQKNIISLFLYVSDINIKNNEKKAVLYCGDGYLNNFDRFSLLQQAMGQTRIDSIYCLQVAHHGAEGNHYKGLASDINSIYSLFSANPNDGRYGHPHSPVLRDFANHKPIVTGTSNNFSFTI